MSDCTARESEIDGAKMCKASKSKHASKVPDFNYGFPKAKERIAKMSVDSGALFYKMNHKKRGVCLILNYEKFFVVGYDDRSGTSKDRDDLFSTFLQLGFDVIVENDLTHSATMRRIKKVAEWDHSDNDCFVMCVLSHGEQGAVLSTDKVYKNEELFLPFTADNCPSLAGKPKMFFIQACQGDRMDAGVTMTSQFDSCPSYTLPVHADFLIAYATIPGFYSWRNTNNGSWFIQALVTELEESAMLYDMLTILTFVNRRVAIEYESYTVDPKMRAKKQIPYVTFMLTRLVKFPPNAPYEYRQ